MIVSRALCSDSVWVALISESGLAWASLKMGDLWVFLRRVSALLLV